jgi:predicted NACHT family NTPase
MDAPNQAAGLLFEDDFIEPWANSQEGGRVSALHHRTRLGQGQGPRLCIVLAPAGFGKSKLTHILAKRLAKIYSEKMASNAPLPYLIPFGDYRRTTSFEGLLLQAQSKQGTALLTPEAFRYMVARRRALFILDGYDEMLEQQPETAKDNIAEFISKAGPEAESY